LHYIREQFIALHSSPILENLSQFFLQRFTHLPPHLQNSKRAVRQKNKNSENAASHHSLAEIEARKREMLFRQVPTKGELDLSVVKDSVYFFS
jgi:DNA-directed RNA polymerase, mitochondrial